MAVYHTSELQRMKPILNSSAKINAGRKGKHGKWLCSWTDWQSDHRYTPINCPSQSAATWPRDRSPDLPNENKDVNLRLPLTGNALPEVPTIAFRLPPLIVRTRGRLCAAMAFVTSDSHCHVTTPPISRQTWYVVCPWQKSSGLNGRGESV